MKIVRPPAPIMSKTNASSQNSAAIDASQLISVSLQAIPGDATMVSTMKIQASNDVPPVNYRPDQFTPTNWTDIASATASLTGGASGLILLTNMCYSYIRIVNTVATPGNTTIKVNMFGISI